MPLRALLTGTLMVAVVGVLLIAACSGGDDRTATPGTGTPVSTPSAGGDAAPTGTAGAPAATARATAAATATATATASPTVPPVASPPAGALTANSIRLEPALAGRVFDRPIELAPYSIGSGAGGVFVADQAGVVLGIAADGSERTLLDIGSRVSRSGNEEGLLSMSLDPAFIENGHVWLYYSVAGGERRTRLARFTADLRTGTIDPATELVVLEQSQPYSNHNGGAVRFGPDGMLYLGLGDGGAAGDPGGNGQDLATLLGSVIRIDVRASSRERPYAVPIDNPWVGTAGARPELWARGLRNPWRMAFDPDGGELWLADVGQNAWEEVDLIERGGNYGWNITEGAVCFQPRTGCDRTGLIEPIAVYSHDVGCSVSGGFVYRGAAVPALTGAYVYGDFCSGAIWALDTATRAEPVPIGRATGRIAGFGRDATGELYVLVFGGPILRIAER